jgi:hypothetical protein
MPFGDPNIALTRIGTCYDHNPNASMPKMFEIKITPDTCKETWAEGLIMYHNPNAKIPVDSALFPSIAHCYFEDGQLISYLPDFHPFGSLTVMSELVSN